MRVRRYHASRNGRTAGPPLRAVRWLPPLHATLYNFGCLQGSRNHRKLAEGEWVYGRLVLVKRPDGGPGPGPTTG